MILPLIILKMTTIVFLVDPGNENNMQITYFTVTPNQDI